MRVQRNINLAPYTTFNIGGPADFFIVAKTSADVKRAVILSQKQHLPIFALGHGSNILVPDYGLRAVVLKMEIKNIAWNASNSTVRVGAGFSWDDLVAQSVERGLYGLENLSLIPGTVGGAVYQNIGAYGRELKEFLISVKVLDTKTGHIQTLSRRACRLTYRSSLFRTDSKRRYIILEATLELSKQGKLNINYADLRNYFADIPVTLSAVRQAVVEIRHSKLPYPDETPNAGSYFKNPMVSDYRMRTLEERMPGFKGVAIGVGQFKVSAAKLIELAGWKGKTLNSVGVSPKHALVLSNNGQGKAQDILTLSRLIIKDIENKFGVTLEPEVEYVGV